MVRKKKKKLSHKVGLPPGALVHIGEQKVESIHLSVIDYDSIHYKEEDVDKVETVNAYKNSSTVSWLNINGLHDQYTIKNIGENFAIHSLVLEDIMNTAHRPKIEIYDEYIFIVIKMIMQPLFRILY